MHSWIRGLLPILALGLASAAAAAQGDSAAAKGPMIRDSDILPVTTGLDSTRLRVCSDPNNMPFSNRDQQGFENKIAELIAKDWGLPLAYNWFPQRRGFVRATLNARRCDLVVGVPTGYDPLATTAPYYRSTYVFVYPADKGWNITSLDDPVLKKLRIGVNTIGDDYSNPPPVQALADRGILGLKGYSVYGDYSQESPPHEIIDAVGRGEIDVAIVWGPLAGYYAKHQPVRLKVTPLPPSGREDLPFEFDVSMGVRRSDKEFKAKVEDTIRRRQADIRKILEEYAVPVVAAKVASGT
jgi:quinoprotein dehydrogenase-associated probable ABC transporter substrate-binding protein